MHYCGPWSACPLPLSRTTIRGRMLSATGSTRRSLAPISSFIARKLDILPLSADALLTSSPTTWYILQCGIHRIASIYSPAPSASGGVGRRGVAPDTRGLTQESRKGRCRSRARRNTQGSHVESDSRKRQARRLSLYASVSEAPRPPSFAFSAG
jgi:hypothetical protein